MDDGDERLTLRESALLTVICVPLTVGLAYLLEYLEGVQKSGWVWWPALLVFLFSAACALGGTASLVWRVIGPAVDRFTGGACQATNRFLEWLGSLVAYAIFTTALIANYPNDSRLRQQGR